jgi:hypothetical protein
MAKIGNIEQVAEPNRENYAVLRKDLCRLESLEAGRLAQNVSHRII